MQPVLVSSILIGLISLGCILVLLKGIKQVLRNHFPRKAAKRILTSVITITGCWLLLVGILAAMDFFAGAQLPPKPVFAMLFALSGLVAFSFTKTGKQLLLQTPIHWLIFFQSFRILVELWFWHGYRSGVFPQVMSFEGNNHDIFAGLLAIAAGFLVRWLKTYNRPVIILYNIAGIMLLANTLRGAILSMPSPIQRFDFDERILLLGELPFIYLPALLVPLAFGFHVLSLRQAYLLQKNK